MSTIEELRELHNQYLWPCDHPYYEYPIALAQGKGALVWDSRGKEYLDCFGGVLSISAGHCHPRVTEVVTRQINQIVHTSTAYLHKARVMLAQKLAEITPGELRKSFFTVSGSEATDKAVELAMMATGNTGIISFRHGYHGQTVLGKELVGQAPWKGLPPQIAGVRHANHPHCYRCDFGLEYPSCQMKCAYDIGRLIETETSGRIAAFIAEPIAGIGGFIPVPKEYFQIVVPIIHEHGGLFICDEVQTGFGRLGETMFGIEQWGVEADIMTMAKGAADGFPIGIIIARPEIADKWRGPTFSTFGGDPISCVAALATLEVIEEEGLMENAARVGKVLREGLCDFLDTYYEVGDVRGWGLMQAIEFVGDTNIKGPNLELTARFMEECREGGLLVGKGGLKGNCIRIGPPLCITEEQIRRALDIMGEVLKKATAA